MLRVLFAGLLGLALTGAPRPVMSERVELTPEDAYQTAFASLNAGQSKLANGLADALLQRDPREFRILILKSRAARNIGLFDEAREAGRTAFQVAQTDVQKFSAAMVTAQALASDGKRTRAQIWLRRAADLAPNKGSHALAARDFQYVRARNPWATQLSFNISPSSNINNGSARETAQLFGLPFEFQLSGAARALEGVEYATSIASRYRFDEGNQYAQDITAQISHRTYSLSSDAKTLAPGVSGSDFAFSQIALGYTYQRKRADGRGRYALTATVGQSWYGGADYFSYLRLGGHKTLPLGDATALTFGGSGERQFGANAPDADILRFDLRLTHGLGKLGRIGLSLGHSDSASAVDVSDFSELRTGLDFSLAKPVLGANLRFGLEWRQRDYIRSRYAAGGRNDRELSANVDMVFTGIERFGFNPTLSLHASRTDSNIGLFDRDNLGLSLGLRSAF